MTSKKEETKAPAEKAPATAPAKGVFLVTDVTPEQTFGTLDEATARAKELAETHPGKTIHIFESVANATGSEDEVKTGEQSE